MKSRPGIYAIRNSLNMHLYVGSSVRMNHRCSVHRYELRRGTHHSVVLQRAWDKYGESAFEFLELEYVDDPNKLLEREQYYLDTLKPAYNVCEKAGNVLGYKHTEDALQKMKAARAKWPGHTEESRRKMSASHKGVPLAPEHAANAGATHLGKKRTETTRQRMRETWVRRRERGDTPPSFEGRRHTEEAIEKNRQAKLANPTKHWLGKKRSPEDIEKFRQSHLGKKLSPESIAKREATKRAKRLEQLPD